MKFVELGKEEFTDFLEKHPLRTFFQTVEMESIGNQAGFTSYYVGVKDEDKILAASRITSREVRFGKKIFYAPRGVLVDYKNEELVTFFIKNIKKYVKERGGYAFHIDPPVIYKERDINGELVEGGIDNSSVVDFLKKIGFRHDGFTRSYDPTKQVRWSFELPLKGKTKEDILKEMSGNTRRAIQKAEHLKVKVRELSKEELPILKEIMDHTSERREFVDKSMEYYELMYDLFHDKEELKYMVAEVDLNNSIESIDNDLTTLEEEIEKAKGHHKEAKLKELLSQKYTLKNRKEELLNLQKEKGNHLYLACSMFIIYGNDMLYYHAGARKEYMNFFGQYLIQWKMIQEAIDRGLPCYNFYGIKGVFDPKDKDYGVYLFKKGFHGHVVEYIGDFYLPTSFYYYLQKLVRKMKGRNG